MRPPLHSRGLLPHLRRSTGHLARDWNQCLVNGFGNLSSPTADMVVCMQADNQVAPDFISRLQKLHTKYDMVNAGTGDSSRIHNIFGNQQNGDSTPPPPRR